MSRNLPQTYEQMIETASEKKGGRIYKTTDKIENADFTDERIAAIVGGGMTELASIAATGRVLSLSDTEAVKERTILYVRACQESATIPTFSGLARSFGMSQQALSAHMKRNPDSKTTEWLNIVHDSFGDMMAEAASRNLTNTIFSIFSLKCRNNWRETIQIEPPDYDPLGTRQSSEAIAAKWEEIGGLPDD